MYVGGDVTIMTNDNRARFTFRMPETLYRELEKRADGIGISKNALIIQILWKFIKESEGELL